jgi:soluble lytic murein transglycosylase-like protein
MILVGIVSVLVAAGIFLYTRRDESGILAMENWDYETTGATLKDAVYPVTGAPILPKLPPLPPANLSSILHWRDEIRRVGRQGVPLSWILAVIKIESAGNPDAVNPSDPSSGLMQTIPLITRAFGGVSGTNREMLEHSRNPSVSLRAGIGFLADLKRKYENRYPLGEWILAYNSGETNFNKGFRGNKEYGRRFEIARIQLEAWI